LGPEEAGEMLKEVHVGECGEHQGKKKLYRCILQIGYYWPTIKRDIAEFVKKCHSYQVQANLIHTHPQSLHSMDTPWPFHIWGLNLIGLVNPPSHGYIWILIATEYFTKWAEAIQLRKATRGVVANFIKENIIVQFGVPHRIISDNGTPFVNREVGKKLEFYRVKHTGHRPITCKGIGRQKKKKILIKIISKMNQEYSGGWATHLPDALWAYRSSPKSATGFSPFSLVYRTEVVSPAEVMIPSLRVMQARRKEKEKEVFMV